MRRTPCVAQLIFGFARRAGWRCRAAGTRVRRRVGRSCRAIRPNPRSPSRRSVSPSTATISEPGARSSNAAIPAGVVGGRRFGGGARPEREHRVDVVGGRRPERDHPKKSTLRAMTFRGWPEDALDFYVGLEADNSKTYFHADKQVYDECVKAPFLELSAEIEREFGPMHVFRPNRDIRFAKDKTPYKTAAAAVTEGEGGTAYYVQISSGASSSGPATTTSRPTSSSDSASPSPTRRPARSSPPRSRPLRKQKFERRRARVTAARAARLSERSPAARAPPDEGHARRAARSVRPVGCTPPARSTASSRPGATRRR